MAEETCRVRRIKLGSQGLEGDKSSSSPIFVFSKPYFQTSMNTSAAVSAANLLLKSVEAVLPKQKKNLAIVRIQAGKSSTKEMQ